MTESRARRRGLRAALAWLAVAGWLLALPGAALAHGPVAPVATSYLARITSLPAGLQARIVDGYVRIWLQASPRESVVVLDYLRAPYVRLTRAGVYVNHNSQMYYLNQTPYPAQPPPGLSRSTPPRWVRFSGGHAFEWHDGRLQDLSSQALLPGQRYLGAWSIPILLDGRPAAIAGGLWHSPRPSPLWFWPIAVALLCVIAAWRVRSAPLDGRVAAGLAAVALAALATTGIGEELHGRPTIALGHLLLLALIAGFVAWSAQRLARRRAGWLTYLAISMATLWAGVSLIPTLLNAYVLIALPAFLARVACVSALGSGAGLLFFLYRLADRPRQLSSGSRGEPVAAQSR